MTENFVELVDLNKYPAVIESPTEQVKALFCGLVWLEAKAKALELGAVPSFVGNEFNGFYAYNFPFLGEMWQLQPWQLQPLDSFRIFRIKRLNCSIRAFALILK